AALSFGYGLTDARGYTSVYNFEGYGDPAGMRLSEIHDNTTATPGPPGRLTTIDRNLYGDITDVARGTTARQYIYSSSKPRNIEQVIEPETGTTTYNYLNDGTLDTVQTGSSVTSYSHDKVGRLELIDYPGATPDVEMIYYPNGELQWVKTGAGSADENIWEYILNGENDLSDEILSVDGQTFNVNYSHNNLGQVDSITYPSGLVTTVANDALGRTTAIPNFVNHATHHPNGSLASLEYVNGQIMTITQNTRQLPENMSTARNSNTLVDIGYRYDLNNNIEQITDPRHGNKILGYDGVNRLYTANGPWGSGNIGYDDNDNIQNKIIGSQSLSYNYNTSNNLLTGISGSEAYSFSYDDYGNVSGNGRNTFSYDDASNLRSSGGNNYLYDGHNRRVMVNNAGSKQYYVYASNGQLMHRFKPTEDQTTDYVYLAGQLVAKLEHKPDPLEVAGDAVISSTG
ncbi:MAG: hypothetical protein GY820_19710, partial [Gammaproteobacteria bacterium]|nr:hypothetical protein [Gammaproteobacteria bacterium]